jgi:hypothetical protein
MHPTEAAELSGWSVVKRLKWPVQAQYQRLLSELIDSAKILVVLRKATQAAP